MSYLNILSNRFVILLLLASLSVVACDGEEDSGDDSVKEQEDDDSIEEQEEEEVAAEPEINSSFTYIPFRPDVPRVEQEGHAMAYLKGDADSADDFRVIIAPTTIEFICGNPNMSYKGSFEGHDTAVTFIAAENFALQIGDHPIEFFNVRNIGVNVNQDLRFEITEITDDQIVGHIAHYDKEEDDEAQFSGQFIAQRCDTES